MSRTNSEHTISPREDEGGGVILSKEEVEVKKQQVDNEEYVQRGVDDYGFKFDTHVDEAYKVAGQVAITFTEEEDRAVRRKIDKRVPVLLAAVYFSQFLDKTILGYAAITGLPIKGQDYNQVSAAFYYGFLTFVFPTANFAQRFPYGPTVYLGINVTVWGIVLACTSISPHFGPFFALRFVLGMLESCVTPVLISTVVAFYKKEEQAKRIACFYAMNGLTEIIGPLIAYAVTFYNGNSLGNQPWRLMYIVFGSTSFVLGIVVIFFLPASPMTARFLNKEEKRIALERVRDNASGTTQKKLKFNHIKEAALDGRVWLALLFICLTSIPNGGLSNFSSIILKSFGYTSRETLLIGLPKGVLAMTFTILCAWLSDRFRERMLPVLVALIPTIVGAAILVAYGANSSAHKAACVFAIYIADTFGSSLSIVYAWNATNVGGSSKKTAAYAAMMCSFAVGNIAGTYIFQAKDAPNYIPGKVAVLVTLVVAGCDAVLLRFMVSRANVKKAENIEKLKLDNGWSDEDVARHRDALAFQDLTDKQNPYFRYTH